MANTTPEQEAAWAAQKAECLERHNRCKAWFKTGNRERIKNWLATLPADEQQKCRNVLNGMLQARKGHDQ